MTVEPIKTASEARAATPNPIKIVCSRCGSDDVRRDAWAEWSDEYQMWELGTVFDQGYCETCACEASLDEIPLSEEG